MPFPEGNPPENKKNIVMEKNREKRKLVSYYFLVSLLIVLLGTAWWGYRWYLGQETFRRYSQGDQSLSPREWAALKSVLEDKYRHDTYGSTTPEGTLELFTAALEKRDIDLAAKYFVPEKQNKMLSDLQVGLKSGGVESLVQDLKEKKTGSWDREMNLYSLDTFDEYGLNKFSFVLKLNTSTKIWKIVDL